MSNLGACTISAGDDCPNLKAHLFFSQIPEEDSRISFDVFVLVSELTLPSNVPQLQVMKSAITIIINLNEK